MADLGSDAANLVVSITDETTFVKAQVLTSNPIGTEGGQVVRNIPSGTQIVEATGVVADSAQSIPEGVVTPLTLTKEGLLKVKVDDVERRLQEQVVINQMVASMCLLSNERSAAHNYGFELR